MSKKDLFANFSRRPTREDIEEAIRSLARKGLIVDTGRRRWSKRKRSYQIVWVAAEFGTGIDLAKPKPEDER
jgi:hypothetical protein